MRERRKYVAEFIGIFALVFAGTGAIITNDVTHGSVTNTGVALTFGMIVLTMIYAVGDVSGAHFNPAVTLGFFAARRLEGKLILPYVLSQFSGALAASLLLRGLFPQHSTLGATAPAGQALQSLILEIVLTALLMFVILNVSVGAKERGITAGIAVGSVIALEALFAGPISGASMNPARSFAPALVSQHVAYLWIYLVALVTGALIAVVGCRCVRKDCRSVPLHGMIDHPS
jgi:aquaporin Z